MGKCYSNTSSARCRADSGNNEAERLGGLEVNSKLE
jgi:hypothetical protein